MYIHKKLRDFLDINSAETVGELAAEVFSGSSVDPIQQAVWHSSLEELKKVLLRVPNTDLDIILEYQLPLEGERIDALIVGRTKSLKPKALVIELKGWTFADPISENLVVTDLGISRLPDLQVAGYLGKLEFCHSVGELYDFEGVTYMYRMENCENLTFENSVYFSGQQKEFGRYITGIFESSVSHDELSALLNGSYQQNAKLFEAILTHRDRIFESAQQVLAESGIVLSAEQQSLIDEIEASISSGRNVNYLVQGAPGSGKTLLAIRLLLKCLAEAKQTVLAFKNNRLIACIKHVFNILDPGKKRIRNVNGVIKFFATGQINYPGVAEDGYTGNHDVVIYDEAQRMNGKNIKNCFLRGKVNVVFFDEGQRLNSNEKGKLDNFRTVADRHGRHIETRELEGTYRSEGGKEYHEWLEKILNFPDVLTEENAWCNKYELRFFDNFIAMKSALETKRDSLNKTKVALVASYTESPGNFDDQLAKDNIRIGPDLISDLKYYQNLDLNIYWLMKKEEYPPFWVEGHCNELKKCASIYGAQGFEADYIGFVWGRDLVIRNGKWELGNNCLDWNADSKPDTLKVIFAQGNRGNEGSKITALLLLKNRLRIFLSRGIKGTYVFCEDEETRKFLMSQEE